VAGRDGERARSGPAKVRVQRWTSGDVPCPWYAGAKARAAHLVAPRTTSFHVLGRGPSRIPWHELQSGSRCGPTSLRPDLAATRRPASRRLAAADGRIADRLCRPGRRHLATRRCAHTRRTRLARPRTATRPSHGHEWRHRTKPAVQRWTRCEGPARRLLRRSPCLPVSGVRWKRPLRSTASTRDAESHSCRGRGGLRGRSPWKPVRMRAPPRCAPCGTDTANRGSRRDRMARHGRAERTASVRSRGQAPAG
jgi:hypothetical protein